MAAQDIVLEVRWNRAARSSEEPSTLSKPPSKFRLFKRKLMRAFGMLVASSVAPPLLRLLARTWKYHRIDPNGGIPKPCLAAIHHGDMLALVGEFDYAMPNVDILVSHSRDGELVATLVRGLGVGTLRGSSSRGQLEALRGMRGKVGEGHVVVVAVDGPRGPFGVVKAGIILTASQTGVPILPSIVVADPKWQFGSWDRAFVPKPFSRVTMVYGEAMTVPPDASREQLEESRRELESRMAELKRTDPRGAHES